MIAVVIRRVMVSMLLIITRSFVTRTSPRHSYVSHDIRSDNKSDGNYNDDNHMFCCNEGEPS